MPRNKTIEHYNSFVGGLNTEAGVLNFPENASLDEDNMVLNVDGSRQRRLGLAIETGGANVPTYPISQLLGDQSYDYFRWDNVNNDPAISLGVVRRGKSFMFFDLMASAPSSEHVRYYLDSYGTYSLDTEVQFTAVMGKLIMVSSSDQFTRYFELTPLGIVLHNVYIEVRDLWGVTTDLQIDEHPDLTASSVTTRAYHTYNLHNQGWTQSKINSYSAEYGELPSDADIMYLGDGVDTDGDYEFKPSLLRNAAIGTTPAPKGKFILDVFSRGTTRQDTSNYGSVTPPLLSDYEQGNFNSVDVHFGRLFYAGVGSDILDSDSRSPNLSGYVFYTQVLKNEEDFGKCYQAADPTAKDINELVATDGGHIAIPEMGAVKAIKSLNNQLLLFADNGVWAILGANGFTALDYEVRKITNVGVLGAKSIIVAENQVIYWGDGGIYSISLNEISSQAVATDVSVGTIKTFYLDISALARTNAQGYYDPASKRLGWLYNDSTTYDGSAYKSRCTREIIYDAQLKAFYPHTHSPLVTDGEFGTYVIAPMVMPLFNTTQTVEEVVDGETPVTDGTTSVVHTTSSVVSGQSKIKYLTETSYADDIYPTLSLSLYADTSFKDWGTMNYSSYIITGHEVFKDTARYKQVPYLVTHFRRTEDGVDENFVPENESSCLIQARWEWSNSANSGRWGREFQAYRYNKLYVPTSLGDTIDTGFEVITTKNKLRGKGRAISLAMSSEEGKDMHILGWSMSISGGTVV